MNNEILRKQANLVNEINNIIKKSMVSHAYFFEHKGCDYEDMVIYFCKELLKDSTSLQNIKLINQNFDYPEIKILKANGKIIKKEQILDLQKDCLEKPVLGKYIIYIIDGAEYLNASSANTLLKFLEEPEENIIGILISSSRYQVIDTLISRCQILSFNPDDSKDEYGDDILSFINKIINKDYSLFIDIRNWYSLEKQEVLDNLCKIQNYCSKNIEKSHYIKIIEVVEKKKKEFKYNLNIKLFLDDLVLELLEV